MTLGMLFTVLTLLISTTASADTRSYKLGKKWATETSAETLLGYKIAQYAFGANGKPIRSKAQRWCNIMTGFQHYSNENPASKKDWIRGCVDVVMTYTIRNGEIR